MVLRASAGDDAEQRVVVAGENLGGAVQHEVSAVLERAQQEGAEHSVVDDDLRARRVGVGDRGVEIGKAQQRVRARLQPDEVGGRRRAVWSKLTTFRPQRPSSPREQADRAPITAVSDRDSGPRLQQREHQCGCRASAGGEEEGVAAFELPEHPLGLDPDRVRHPLVVERPRRGVGVGVDRGPLERRQAAARELGLPVHLLQRILSL